MEVAARKMKIAVPDDLAIDAEIDLYTNDDGHFLRARLNVSLPGIAHDLAKALVEAGHAICPYSKATRGPFQHRVVAARAFVGSGCHE